MEIKFDNSIKVTGIYKSISGNYNYKSTLSINGIYLDKYYPKYEYSDKVYRLKCDCDTVNIDKDGNEIRKYLKDNEEIKNYLIDKDDYKYKPTNCETYYEREFLNPNKLGTRDSSTFIIQLLSDDLEKATYVCGDKNNIFDKEILWNGISVQYDLDDIIKQSAEKTIKELNNWFDKL